MNRFFVAFITVAFVMLVSGFSKSEWEINLAANTSIPKNKFAAFYASSDNPKKVVFSEIVDRVSVNYPYDQFHGIDSKNFIGYWIGNFEFKEDVTKTIGLELSWAKVKILVDEVEIYNGENSHLFTHKFSKGTHKIEIQYLNNWHTTNFFFVMKDSKTIYDKQEFISQIVPKLAGKDYDIWVGAVYESKTQQNEITLNLTKSNKPLVVVLSSYRAVNWNVINEHKNKILAIVIHNPFSTINMKENIYFTQFNKYDHNTQQKCRCDGGKIWYCEGDTLKSKNEQTKQIYSKNLSGFSGVYSASAINLPEILITDELLKTENKTILELEKEKGKCVNNSIDNVFK